MARVTQQNYVVKLWQALRLRFTDVFDVLFVKEANKIPDVVDLADVF